MSSFPAICSRVSSFCVAMILAVGCVNSAFAQAPAARIRLLEENPDQTYSVRDIGRIPGAVRLALPEGGGRVLVLTEDGEAWEWGGRRDGLGTGRDTGGRSTASGSTIGTGRDAMAGTA